MDSQKAKAERTIIESRLFQHVLLVGSGILLTFLIVGALLINQQREIQDASSNVRHTYRVLMAGKDVYGNIQRMLQQQRGYIQTLDNQFKIHYFEEKSRVAKRLDALEKLTHDNASQKKRVERIQTLMEELSAVAEKRLAQPSLTPAQLKNRIEVTRLGMEIEQTIDALMNEEGELLNQRLTKQRADERHYDRLLLGGIIGASAVIIVLNALVLGLAGRKARLQRHAELTDERFAMAMKGTSDGIFDWDIPNNTVFYSPRFKEMLGYHDHELDNDVGSIRALIHPEDAPATLQYTDDYLAGKHSELNTTYRIQHRMGHYIWFHTRAKAVFSKQGTPQRLIGASADITSIKAIEERLRVEKELAVSANRAKTDFLTNMSHEIRTPLNAIIGVSNILSRKMVKDPAQQEQLVNTLQQSSLALLDLINDILDLAKIESGEIDLEYRRFPLVRPIQQISAMMQVRAQEKGIRFTVEDAEIAALNYIGDEARLRQILINLIGNALKFTEQGEVVLSVMPVDGEIQFAVRDTGIGIDAADLEKIFLKFEQADSSTTRKYGGTGLGLSISQKLAHIMGGHIEVKSEKGRGSCFSLLLPDNTERGQLPTQSSALSATAADTRPAIAPGKRVLIVEDFENNLLVIRYFLDHLGVAYDVARDGAQAVECYQRKRHAFILMDVQMPVMDGLEATRKIRDYEQKRELEPSIIVAMTAHAMAGDSARCLAAGMDDYLSKPLIESDLRQKLAQYLPTRVAQDS